jgi:hypothetical protein
MSIKVVSIASSNRIFGVSEKWGELDSLGNKELNISQFDPCPILLRDVFLLAPFVLILFVKDNQILHSFCFPASLLSIEKFSALELMSFRAACMI